jgi:hypothetical protein
MDGGSNDASIQPWESTPFAIWTTTLTKGCEQNYWNKRMKKMGGLNFNAIEQKRQIE